MKKRASIIGGAILALPIVGGAYLGAAALGFKVDRPAWQSELDEVAQVVQQIQMNVQLMRWQFLAAKQENEGLSPSERVEFCALAKALGLASPGCTG